MTTTTSPCRTKCGAVVPRDRARAEHVRAAVDPHHHRPARVVARRCPHVEVQAVLARAGAVAPEQPRDGQVGLRDLGRELRRVADAVPCVLRARAAGSGGARPGGAANGMPRNTSTPSCSTPSIFPLRVAAMVMRTIDRYGPVGRLRKSGSRFSRNAVSASSWRARRPCGRTPRLRGRVRRGLRRSGRRARAASVSTSDAHRHARDAAGDLHRLRRAARRARRRGARARTSTASSAVIHSPV